MQINAKVIAQQHMQRCPSSYQLIADNNPIFNQRIQNILNTDFQEVRNLGIFQSTGDPTPNLFYYRAQLYKDDLGEAIEDFMIHEIDHFYNNSDQTYAIAYIHSCFVDFITFRKSLQKWPEHFFRRLRRVYIVDGSFVVKIIEICSFGAFYRLCDQLFLDIQKISDLKEVDGELMRSLGEDPDSTVIHNKNSIKIIENGLYGKKINDYDLYSGKYPVIILRLLARLVRNPDELKFEGVFRKTCSYDELQRMQDLIMKNNLSCIQDEKDILVVSGLLKKILNNLKLPLFNYAIYDRVVKFKEEDLNSLVKEIYGMMDYVNQKVFVLMIIFLSEYVVAQMEYNRMSAYNLSVVFGPCFFRPKQYSLNDLIYSTKFGKVLTYFFDHQKTLIPESQRQLALTTLQQLNRNSIKL